MYLFCSDCKPIFTFCSIFVIFQKKRPNHLEVKAKNKFEIYRKWPNRRDEHVPFAHDVLAHEGLARQSAVLRGDED